MRELELGARAKRRDDWDRLAFLRQDLRRLLTKNADKADYCDFNPIYSEKERRAIRTEIRRKRTENLAPASALDVFYAASAK